MKRIIIFLLIILGIVSCSNPKETVKKDLEKLKVALEKYDKEFKQVVDTTEKVYKKSVDEMPMYKNFNATEEEKNKEKKAKEERYKGYITEILSVKRPDTKEIREIITRLKKNVSKVKTTNQAEIGYYYYINNIIEEVNQRIEKVDNFEEFVNNSGSIMNLGFATSQLKMENIIYNISELQKYPI